MRDRANPRLERYLRVAYEGAEAGDGQSPHREVRSRWAVSSAVAVRVAAVLLVVAIAGITVFLLSQRGAAPAAPLVEPTPPLPASTGPLESPTTAAAVVVVHVAGAVAEPGVVELPPGTRVAEAIDAAGGATEDADLDALNLATQVTDGQQVYVPAEGEVPPPAAGDGGAGAPGAPGASTGLVDVNTADAVALESLPGIGPALAQRIIDHRTEHGPFASVEALTDVSGIGPATLERLRDLVTV